MDESNNGKAADSSKLVKLKEIAKEIKESWLRDCDKTEYMIELINILKEILTKESLEEYFSEDEKILPFFMDEFQQEVLGNILIQPKIYGENGDEIGLELLLNIFKLFLKFHRNNAYSPLFTKIRYIFHQDHGSSSFFSSHKCEDDEKNYTYYNFNSKFCSGFEKNENAFNVGDEVDFLIENESSKNSMDKKSYVRGKIKEVQEDKYIIEFCEENEIEIPKNEFNLCKKETKTSDWDWRTNLKKYDVIDCYDRSKWYPATILDVKEKENNGYKKIVYYIAFRLYVDHFKNPDDENDTYDKHIDVWKNNYSSDDEIKTDDDNEKYIGDGDNCSEEIIFYSKRIQKFNTFTAAQKKDADNNVDEEKSQSKLMTEKLANDNYISIEDYYSYEVNGKKNYILGKNNDSFYYYYARLLKMMENENTFSEFIEILKNQPNTEEIYNIFFILTYCFPYLHRDYFKENSEIIKKSLIDYINGLKEKEMRSLPKDLIEIISNLLNKINENSGEEKTDKEDSLNLYDEVTLTLSMKTIKTSIFDRRLQGIKALNDFIEKNKEKKDILKKIIVLIKKNSIISEIFGPNYHSQLISRSNEIVKLLLIENELSEEDIKLIWSCTKRGDLEAKLTILKLLSELAPNLKENYIEMLLNNVRTNVDKKINEEEIELVYKLSMQGESNEKNIEHCCDYLCQCLLLSNDPNIKKSPILERLLNIIEKDKKFLKKVFDICNECISKNEKAILSYSILIEVLDKFGKEENEIINDFTKDKCLLKLFENNFHLYIEQAKIFLNKNNISFSEGEIIDKSVINGFTHYENIKKRMQIFPYLINNYYTDYDFLPFLKNILIENAVSPNDQLVFYDFVKKYISSSENINVSTIVRKEKIRKDLFEMISESKQSEITPEQIKLFIALFFDMNKEKIKIKENIENDDKSKEAEYEVVEVKNIDELAGLDKLWNIIFSIKDEKILSIAINIVFQIYKNEYIEKLFEKCNDLIKDENATPEAIEKCIILLKLIIIESEKNLIFRPKSHLSLLKNCLINLPLKIKGKKLVDEDDDVIKKYLLFGNSNINDLKILLSKLYKINPKTISFSFTDKFLDFLKKNKLIQKEEIDESNNNNTLNELIVEKNPKLKSDLKPKEKIAFKIKTKKQVKLVIDGEMNPRLKNIIKEWFSEFTEGNEKMDKACIARFIRSVTQSKAHVSENEPRVTNFLKQNDKDGKGYITEEDFINFYDGALKKGKEKVVWDNLKEMGIEEDLSKKEESFSINYEENEKLPRYKLGNDLAFIQKFIQKYYKNQNANSSLIDFLLYLTTNENIYNDVLENLFNSNEETINKDSFVYKAFNDSNSYAEQNYIFIIIESILQDLEIHLYNKYIEMNDFIMFNNTQYKIVSEKYEPFDNDEKNEKKINFLKNLVKAENFQKILKQVNNLLDQLSKLINDNNDNTNIISKYIDTCLRGLKIINIINNCNSGHEKENKNCLNGLKENDIYNLGFCNLSSLLGDEEDFKKELEKISFFDLANNLINYLINSQKFEKDNQKSTNLQKECLDLLIYLLSSNKQLSLEYTSKDESKKQTMINLFKNYFSENESSNKTYFIQNINNSISKSENSQNTEYIDFLFQIVNSLLDNLIKSQIQSESQGETEQKDKTIFTPDNEFFNLYNNLFKIKSENKDKEKGVEKDNSHIMKIYDLVMKNINNIEQKKKVDIKIFISLLQILKTQIKDNDKLKIEILFKDVNGISLFSFLLQKLTSQINPKKEETLIDSDNNETNENEEKSNTKFILLEGIKKEKTDDTSNEELMEISNEFIFDCLEEAKDNKLIKELLKILTLLKNLRIQNGKDGDSDEEDDNNNDAPTASNSYSSRSCGHVGLKNLGCICYMNSIIQQMYMVPTFRYAIMSADDGEPENPSSSNYHFSIDDDNLLHQLQNMYTYLTFSEKMDYNPREFCYSYKDLDGNPTNVRAQQDSQEFYNNFCDKIENSLKKTKFKYIVADVFSGKTCSSVRCESCKHMSNRFEDYYNLTLEVKNIDNLKDSLQKLNVPEIIDDFKCSNCNQKVTINKVTSLNKLPNILVVHLKRFYLDYETCNTKKINSKFEFPRKLNLKQFCVEEITKNISKNEGNAETPNETLEIYYREDSYYEYELKGINVHTGSADGGHYFSFIDVNRDGKLNILNDYPKENWLIFNDSKVSEFDTDTIPKECYGGPREGFSFDNCQNAYLLIYERKKKTPIKILLEENNIDKEKEKDNIIKITKDNKSQINKEYDLSRLNTDKKEEDLYNKIFFDEEKNEYYKYIPYYSIPKYAPRKVYTEIMKENHTTPSTNVGEKKISSNYKKYKSILISLLNKKQIKIQKDNYDDKSKELIISIALKEFMKGINSNQSNIDEFKEEVNSLLSYIIEKLLKPLINEDTNINILKVINRILLNEDESQKNIFYNQIMNDNIISIENAKSISEILYDLINIFLKKAEDHNYKHEFKFLLSSLLKLLKGNFQNNENNDEIYSLFYMYELFYKLIKANEKILEYYLDGEEIIITLLRRLELENKIVREKIYEISLYIIKQTKEYNKKLFDLEENEKEGKFEFKEKDEIERKFTDNMDIIKILFKEKNELLIMLVVILANNNINFSLNFFYKIIYHLYQKCKNKLKYKIKDLLDILSSLVTINDKYTFKRLYHIFGYPNLIIKQIPRIKNDSNSDDNNDSDSDNPVKESEKEAKLLLPKQNWPLFGERLIDGDINRPIYEYVGLNHRYNGISLLGLLLPNENELLKNEEKKEKTTDNNDEDNNDDSIKVNISNEIKKDIILKLLYNCFGEKNNFALFKYIYLTPARCLLYKNLYEEMKHFVQEEDKNINFENIEKKAEKFIKYAEKQINDIIEKTKNKEKDEDFNRNDSDDEEEQEEFKIFDINLKSFIGFNSDIIPGQIVREEISQIAATKTLALYRIQYFTKYFKTEELRDILLNKKNGKEVGNEENSKKEEEKKDVESKNENKEEKKEENNCDEKYDNDKKESKEENKNLDAKDESLNNTKTESKKEEKKKDEENNEEEKKDEENNEEGKKDEEKKEEIKKNEEKKDEEKKEVENEDKKEEEKKDEEKKEEIKKDEKKKDEEKKEEEKKDEDKKEEEKKDEEKKEEEKKDEEKEEKKDEDKKEEEKKEEEKKDGEKKEEEKKDREKKEEEKKDGEKKEEEKKDEEKKDEEKKEVEKKHEDKKEEEKKDEEKKEEIKKDEEKKDEEKKEEEKKDEEKKEEEKKNEDKKEEEKKDEDKKEAEKKEDEKKDEVKKEEEIKDEEKKEEEKKQKEKKEEEKKEEEKKDEEKKEEDKKEEDKKDEDKKDEEKKEVQKKDEEKKEEERKDEEKKDEEKKDEEKKDEEKKEEDKKEEEKKDEEKKDEEKKDEEKKGEEKKEEERKEEEKKEEEKKDEDEEKQKNDLFEMEQNEKKLKEKEEEESKKIETEINDELETKKSGQKYDISEKNENDFIYDKNPKPIILEDEKLKDRNKVKSTLYRFIFTNKDSKKKNFRAIISSKGITGLMKLNSFLPTYIFDKMEANDNVNFYNVVRIKGDLPFLKRDDGSINIDFGENIDLSN